MNDQPAPSANAEPATGRHASRSRAALLKRLADVVCLPASRINAFERAMTADLLVEMLRDAVAAEREKVARRLANLAEMPGSAGPAAAARRAAGGPRPARAFAQPQRRRPGHLPLQSHGHDHRRLIAHRRGVSEVVADALVDMGETAVHRDRC
jgi:hypothetical protein